MPELPEVETVARQLDQCLRGARVQGLCLLDPRLTPERPERLAGRLILGVFRQGKEVLFRLAPDGTGEADLLLCVHLRMTGRLIVSADGAGDGTKHRRAVVALDRGSLHFHDPRRFGTLRVLSPAEFRPGPGMEPLSTEFTAPRLARLAHGSRQEIKPWLLRQDRLVGLGNIYASEILFDARIDPRRRAGSLAPSEVRALHRSVRRVLRRAIRMCGTTFSDFQDARGAAGRFGRMLAVYGRAGEPCPACRNLIRRIVQQGRSTFYCPTCQH